MLLAVCSKTEGLEQRCVVGVQCVSHSVCPVPPWPSSGPEVRASSVVGSESWLTGRHSCQVVKPLDPLLLSVAVDGCCSTHLADLLIPDHVSSGPVNCSCETSHLACVNLSFKDFVEGPGVTLFCQRLHKHRADQPGFVFMGLLGCFRRGASW